MDGFESHFKAVSRVACVIWCGYKGGERSNGTPRILTWAEATAMMFVERGAGQQEMGLRSR